MEASARQVSDGYVDAGGRLSRLEAYCSAHAGGTVFLTGPSGSGKTTLLKKFVHMHREDAACFFADVLPADASVGQALWLCMKQFTARGLLPEPGPAPETRGCVEWLRTQLQKLHTSRPVCIVLDSVEQLWDWKEMNGSLTDLELPEKMTLLIGCISEKSLNLRDHGQKLQLDLLQYGDAMTLLEAELTARGRCLTARQMEHIRCRLPASVTPLYISLLGSSCCALTSLQSAERIQIRATDAENIRARMEALSAEYPVFTREALGCLALSEHGLQEQELLELLAQDDKVRHAIARNSQWNIPDEIHLQHVISVLWARMYYELRTLLSETVQDGIVLLSFSHSLILQEAEKMVAGSSRKLQDQLLQYFRKQPYTYRDSTGAICVNTRKLDELAPLLQRQQDWYGLQALLGKPEYIDSCLRCGRYVELMGQYRLLQAHFQFPARQQNCLRLLKRHSMLLQNWSEAWLPTAVNAGLIAEPSAVLLPYDQHFYFAGNSAPVQAEGFWEESLFLPELQRDAALAPLDARWFAAKRGDRICIYDWQMHGWTGIDCQVSEQSGFLYWQQRELVFRQEKRRTFLRFDPDRRELYIRGSEGCPDWGGLLLQSRNQAGECFRRAGGVLESDAFTTIELPTFCYFSAGRCVGTELVYPYGTDLRIRLYGHLAAVYVQRSGQARLEILDLDRRAVCMEVPCENLADMHWNPTGSVLLLVSRDGHVACLQCDTSIVLRTLPDSPTAQEGHSSSQILDVVQTKALPFLPLILHPVQRTGMPWTDDRQGTGESRLAAIHAGRGWLAIYTWTDRTASAQLALYELSAWQAGSRKPFARCLVAPVCMPDAAVDAPILQPSVDGSAVILRASGWEHRLKIESLRWKHGRKKKQKQSAAVQAVRKQYVEELQFLPALQYQTDFTENLAGAIVMFGRLMGLTPRKKKMVMQQSETGSIRVLEQDGRIWILNPTYGLVHVCDPDGKYLCHLHFDFPVLALEVHGDTVYALPRDLSAVVQRRLCTVRVPDA